jgi:DNA-binding LacI/PurR family transcriptional regulator
MGELAAENLISHLGGNHSPETVSTVVIKSDLVVRQSSLKMG